MHRTRHRPELHLRTETIRQLATNDLRRVVAGYRATSEAIDGYPCPGEYSWACTP